MNNSNLLNRSNFKSEDWSDWKWQMRNSITNIDSLQNWVNLSNDELEAIEKTKNIYKWRITPHYLDLINKFNPNCPIRKQAIPSLSELNHEVFSDVDPVGDKKYRVTNRIIHKYPNRIVLLVTSLCPVYCRHCTRKYHTTAIGSSYFEENEKLDFELDFDYIMQNTQIQDVLLTGGDPLSYSDEKLKYILENLRKIKHIKIIRIGTRFPVLLPQRITDSFCDMISKFSPIWINTHFNHPTEINDDAIIAIKKLIKYEIPLGNQTVLMKGINDNIETIKELNELLIFNKIRPYYLYHCDNVKGVSHFRTTINEGIEIMKGLIGNSTGFSIPQYVVTTEIGKIPISPNFIDNHDGKFIHLRNYKNELIEYYDGI